MKQKYVFGIFALAMVAVLGASMVSAHGFGFFNSDITEEEREEMKEKRQAIKTAIESGDYDSWEVLMNERISKMQERINEDTFNELQERHSEMELLKEAIKEAKESGDWSEVESLKEELGIEGKNHFGKKGFHKIRN